MLPLTPCTRGSKALTAAPALVAPAGFVGFVGCVVSHGRFRAECHRASEPFDPTRQE